MIKTIYINIICLFLVLLLILYIVHKRVNKYTYETGKKINKVTSPDIIHTNLPKINNLNVVSDNFTKIIIFIFAVVFLLNGQYKYIIFFVLFYYQFSKIFHYYYYFNSDIYFHKHKNFYI